MLHSTQSRFGIPAQTLPLKQKQLNNIPMQNQMQFDSVQFNKAKTEFISFGARGKATAVASMTPLQNPQMPALQMKVRGVLAHQASSDSNSSMSKDTNVNDLADSNWKDGQELKFRLDKGKSIVLSDPEFGELGRVHDEIAEKIIPAIKKNPKDFKFELSNIIAGTTKGAETIGLRVNLIYQGADKANVQASFNEVLNDPKCLDKVLLYQEKTSPEEVLKRVLDYEKKVNGPESAMKMQNVIQNIVREIENPENKNILLLGHCKPDGDTIGCVLGLNNAIKLSHPEKTVACAIDDKVPGLFRHKLPGIDGEIKHPYNPEKIETIKKQINDLKAKPQDAHTVDQLENLNHELVEMKNPKNLLKAGQKYDLVVLMDIPTPKRFTDKFKNEIEGAKKVIYIDHHPHRLSEWQNDASYTGLDIDKVHANKLAWVADTVPAATQLITILANKLMPKLNDIGNGKVSAADVFKTDGQADMYKALTASVVTGISTDTGAFTRTANLLPEHIKMPAQDRPNFMPEGMSKWLMDSTKTLEGIGTNDKSIDKKWIREEISYDITDEKSDKLGESARELMLKHAEAGTKVNEDLSLGVVQVDYDQMNQVWEAAREKEPETTLLDVQNAFKYSEVLGALRADPTLKGGAGDDKDTIANYQGKYDSDRIAIFVCQDKKAGELDEKLQVAPENGLRLSLRSKEGSIHAELLASLFGGGGHGGAAGGRVDLPGVQLDTPLGVAINGKLEKDTSVILKTLQDNYATIHDDKIPQAKKQSLCKKVDLVLDGSGKNCSDLITDLVTEIRATQPAEETESTHSSRPSKSTGKSSSHKAQSGKSGRGKRRHTMSFTGFLQNITAKKIG